MSSPSTSSGWESSASGSHQVAVGSSATLPPARGQTRRTPTVGGRNGSSGGPARIGEPPDLSRRHDVVIMIFVRTRPVAISTEARRHQVKLDRGDDPSGCNPYPPPQEPVCFVHGPSSVSRRRLGYRNTVPPACARARAHAYWGGCRPARRTPALPPAGMCTNGWMGRLTVATARPPASEYAVVIRFTLHTASAH